MKFVNKIILLVFVLTLTACASQVSKPLENDQVALKETLQYIPQQSFDENGSLNAYEPQENPYLLVDSKIDKGSVLLFIEAKKAKRNKDFKTATQKLLVITQKDTSISGPWVMLGDIKFENKQYKEASLDYQKALVINPENVNAYIALAKVQRVLGQFNLAQNTLENALLFWKDFPEAHLNLGILYDVYLNQAEKAQQHMEAYLFLTQYKSSEVKKWLQEVQSRTGIVESFIEKKIAIKPKQDAMTPAPSAGNESSTQINTKGS